MTDQNNVLGKVLRRVRPYWAALIGSLLLALLYVAMTRPKDMLVMTYYSKSLKKDLEKAEHFLKLRLYLLVHLEKQHLEISLILKQMQVNHTFTLSLRMVLVMDGRLILERLLLLLSKSRITVTELLKQK